MGWNHIPEFYLTYSKDLERVNNPWRGKNPKPSGKVSVALPPDDLLSETGKVQLRSDGRLSFPVIAFLWT